MEASLSIPIVDISAWVNVNDEEPAARAVVAQKWNAALTEYGCAIISGHGIDESVFDRVNEESRRFFARNIEDKLKYNHGIYGHPSGGYTAPGNEIVAMSSDELCEAGKSKPKYDPVENFVFTAAPERYTSPSGEPAPFSSASDYYHRMETTLRTIHQLSCAALGMTDLDYFEQFYNANIPGNETKGINGNALRLAHYPPIDIDSLTEQAQSSKEFDEKVRYGAHTDYQGFTILRPDKTDWHTVNMAETGASGSRHAKVRCGGLEVYHRASKQWFQVRIPEELNALVINAGDLIQRWTNDIWHSPLHRVITASAVRDDTANAVMQDTSEDSQPATEPAELHSSGLLSRQAIVFFTGPLEDCMITCIDPALMTAAVVDSTGPKYPPIRGGDHLLMKLNKTNSH